MSEEGFLVRKCALAGVEAIEARSKHVYGRHTHDAYAVGRIVEGGQRWWSGRGIVEARRGQVITSNPGEVHDGAPLGDTRAWKMLYIEPPVIAALHADLVEGGAGEFEFVNPVFEGPAIAARLERSYSALTEAPLQPLAAETALFALVASLLTVRTSGGAYPASNLVRARELIDSDPAKPLSLADLARESGLSRFQALRGFARLTGLPPHAYQMRRRLEAARRMIARGNSLCEAAAACGFADQSHLHRLFVRRLGITPGRYAAASR